MIKSYIMKKSITVIFLVLTAFVLTAQTSAIREANRLFEGAEYSLAQSAYQQLIDENKNPEHEWIVRLAECFFQLKNYPKTVETYALLSGKEKLPENYYLRYGQSLQSLGNYVTAQEMFNKHLAIYPEDSWAKLLLSSCAYALQNANLNSDYTVMPTNLRLPGYHLGASRYQDGLVFSLSKEQKDKMTKLIYPNYQLVYAEFKKDMFGEIQQIFPSLQSSFYLGSPCFTADGKEMYYVKSESETKISTKRKFSKKQISSQGINTLNIICSFKEDAGWGEGLSLDINSIEYSIAHPTLSKDGKQMYFVSNKSGGKGGYDIYKSLRSGSVWSSPEPVDELNSFGDEMFPVLDNDTTIYFSSNGRIGFGGADVFVSYLRKGKWSKPENLGRPVNSEKDDFGMVNWEGRKTFFASNRNSEPGKDDIFVIERVIHYRSIKGVLSDELTLKPIAGGTVDIIENNKIVASVATDKRGRFEFDKIDPDQVYRLAGKSTGYKTNEVVLSVTSNLQQLEIFLEPVIEKNTVFTFNDILFELAKADLLPASMEVLDRLAELLIKNPGASVELSAHTDSRGSDASNQLLSQQRAESSVRYLISKGVNASQLVAKGYGETRLKNDCANKASCSEEQHAINRRVEIKVLEVK